MQLEKVLFGLSHMKQLLGSCTHWRPEPHKRLLQSLLRAYREWGGDKEQPQIAIVDWKGVSTRKRVSHPAEIFRFRRLCDDHR
jgi:hypothetical protein